MSLKQQVKDPASPVGKFMRKFFPSERNRGILAEIRQKLDVGEPVCLLDGDPRQRPYSLVGHAIDYRIRYHFDHTPAHRLKQAWEGAWAVTNLDGVARILQTDSSRLPGYVLTPFGSTPDGPEDWYLVADTETEDGDFSVWRAPNPALDISVNPRLAMNLAMLLDFERVGLSAESTLDFFDLLDRTVSKIAPHRRQPTRDEEEEFARYCLVLSVFETVSRSQREWPPSFLEETLPRNAADLLDPVPDPWVRDVAELGSVFAASRADWRGAPATLNPEFSGAVDVGGADGDLIVDRCLWDIKTTIENGGKGWWLHQLLGYVLLDYGNEHDIRSVGFLFPRQNASIRWPLTALIRELCPWTDLTPNDLRQILQQRLDPESRDSD